MAESSQLRVIGVPGQIGPDLENALDRLVELGWVTPALREQIPLTYEMTPQGMGWFKFHHHHLHSILQER